MRREQDTTDAGLKPGPCPPQPSLGSHLPSLSSPQTRLLTPRLGLPPSLRPHCSLFLWYLSLHIYLPETLKTSSMEPISSAPDQAELSPPSSQRLWSALGLALPGIAEVMGMVVMELQTDGFKP